MSDDPAKRLFLEAMELPPAERAALLDAECADPAVRARVERLLAAHDEAESFMAAPTLTPPELPSPPVPLGPSDNTPVGRMIGRYRVESLLGEGGFGRVYRAQQREPVSRVVALKVLKPGMDSRAIVARFETERQALAVMDHPSVARVYDAGRTEDGLPYFAMELVRGEPITLFCENRKLTVRQRLELFERVCFAVQHAHHKGIIHRDLKPSNVLVTLVDDKPVPKVIDFGIAKAIGPGTGGDTLATLEGQMIGTPAYMSPEQVEGAFGMDTRSDVYTLGVLLYELLTGVRPFDNERLQRTPLASLAKIIREEVPPRPSTRLQQLPPGAGATSAGDARQLAGRLRGDLDWIVMKALEKEPGRRYQTAFALATDIRRHLRDEPVEAGPPSGIYRLRKFSRRHRGELLAGVLVFVALVAGLVSSLIFAARAEEESHRTARELEKSEESVAFLTNLLSGLDPAVARGEDRTLLRSMLADAKHRLDTEPPRFPSVEAKMRELIGVALFLIADFAEAEAQLRRALDLSVDAVGPDDADTLTIRQQLGEVYIELSRYDDARREITAALEGLSRTLGPEHRQTISAMFHLAMIDRLVADYPVALERFERVLELRTATLGADHPDTVSVLNSIATVADSLGDHDRAIRMYEDVIAYQLEKLGHDHPNTLATQNNLADTLMQIERTAEAVEILEQIIAAKRRVLEADHPSLVVSLNNIAHAYRKLERFDEAEARLAEAVDICARTLGGRDFRTMVITNTLAGLKLETNRPSEAIELVGPVLPVSEDVLGPGHPLSISMLRNLAQGCLDTGDTVRATAHARTLVERADDSLPEGHLSLAGHRRMLAECLLAGGDAAGAEAVLLDAMSLLDKSQPDALEDRAKTAAILARACDALGKTEEAGRWRGVQPPADPERP